MVVDILRRRRVPCPDLSFKADFRCETPEAVIQSLLALEACFLRYPISGPALNGALPFFTPCGAARRQIDFPLQYWLSRSGSDSQLILEFSRTSLPVFPLFFNRQITIRTYLLYTSTCHFLSISISVFLGFIKLVGWEGGRGIIRTEGAD